MDRKRNLLWVIWYNMIKRCTDKSNKNYFRYGGRGISVCEDWKNFKMFKTWAINNGYEKGLSLERKNVNENYCPENCCWITMQEQANNRRTNRIETYNGVTDTVANLCRIFNKNYGLVNGRLQKGKSIQEAMDNPKGYSTIRSKFITYNGETHTIKEWTDILGFKKNTLNERLRMGWSIEKAFNTPVRRKK